MGQSIKNTEGRLSRPSVVPRISVDRIAKRSFFAIMLLPVFLIAIVTIALVIRSWPILQAYPLKDLLFGNIWRPDKGLFGFFPYIVATFWVTTVGVLLATPACILVSIYLAEYAHARTRSIAKPVLDLLAAIPPVVYGVWGLVAIVPFVDKVLAPLSDRWLGAVSIFRVNQPTGFGILAAGILLAGSVAPLIIFVMYEKFFPLSQHFRHTSLSGCGTP